VHVALGLGDFKVRSVAGEQAGKGEFKNITSDYGAFRAAKERGEVIAYVNGATGEVQVSAAFAKAMGSRSPAFPTRHVAMTATGIRSPAKIAEARNVQ
jgi:hypothetical protein